MFLSSVKKIDILLSKGNIKYSLESYYWQKRYKNFDILNLKSLLPDQFFGELQLTHWILKLVQFKN